MQFYRFCLAKYPSSVLKTLPRSAWFGLGHVLGLVDTKHLKQQLFSFLSAIPNIDGVVEEFWQENQKRIGAWYLSQKKPDDVIISASPEFLLKPICTALGVRLIATQMDKFSGYITGNNCHDSEKVTRFQAAFPGEVPDAFYSDSLSDAPMAEISASAYLVKKHCLTPWPTQK